jgi:hypothetical protein
VPRRPVERVEFNPGEAGEVLEAMTTIERAGDGWVNLLPGIDPDDAPPPPRGLTAILAPKTPGAVMATWAPQARARRSAQGATVGLLHSAGRFAARQLAGLGAPVPDGWIVRQDNPRRGLIVEAPADTPESDILEWMIAATTALCTLPLTGNWNAVIYLPRSV